MIIFVTVKFSLRKYKVGRVRTQVVDGQKQTHKLSQLSFAKPRCTHQKQSYILVKLGVLHEGLKSDVSVELPTRGMLTSKQETS